MLSKHLCLLAFATFVLAVSSVSALSPDDAGVAFSGGPMTNGQQPVVPSSDDQPRTYIFTFDDGTPAAVIDAKLDSLKSDPAFQLVHRYTIIPGFAVKLSSDFVANMQPDPSVKIEEDQTVHIL